MSTSPTILVRNNSTNWDPLYGQGQANYIADIYAVAQIIEQKLKLLQGEWWENLNLGFPLFQSILGQFTPLPMIASLIATQILSTPYVSGIQNVQISQNVSTRTVNYSCVVSTNFGTITVTGVNATFTAVIN